MGSDSAAPSLRLVVQYATTRAVPERSRVRRWIRAALTVLANPGTRYVLTVRFVDEEEGRSLNRSFRHQDHATNVLTFPYAREDDLVEADLVLCMPVVEAEAKAQRKDSMDHCAHLVVHGALHASGHDHEAEADAAAMETLERAALERLRIGDPYA